MKLVPKTVDGPRLAALRAILNHERSYTLARVKELRRAQEEEALPLPSDEMDIARSLADVETHASLIETAEDRLKAIDEAFARLEEGSYGSCAQCGEEIPLERLRTIPSARYCVDCQTRHNRVRGAGALGAPFNRRWELPEEMDESLERQDSMRSPEESLSIHYESPFGPGAGEFEERRAAPPRRRGRPRKTA